MGQAESVGLMRELSDSIRGIIEWSLRAFNSSIFFSRLILAELQAHGHDRGTSKRKLALSLAVGDIMNTPGT